MGQAPPAGLGVSAAPPTPPPQDQASVAFPGLRGAGRTQAPPRAVATPSGRGASSRGAGGPTGGAGDRVTRNTMAVG